ncbi:MAG: hypothetical protein E7634_04520 [Ruminococcaceae bacterium]|nr:hypothetical protein [Oscillospiraceae bacterium]
MRGNDLLNKLENIDPAYIEAAAKSPKVKSTSLIRRLGALAACLVLLISAGVGSYIYAEDVKNYNESIKFFNEYGLSTEGLTRGEIKSVYRDITTKSFTYSKTAEVLANSISTDRIEGYEILQENPTPENIENVWNIFEYLDSKHKNKGGINYKYNSEYVDGYRDFVKSNIEKYDGETLVWSASVTEFDIAGYDTVSDGIIVYGQRTFDFSEQPYPAWLAKFDNNGNLKWKTLLSNDLEREDIVKILEHDDGSYAAISRGELKYFCLNLISHDGKPTYFKKTEIGNYGIWNAARLGDGYIVQLGSYIGGQYASIVKVDGEGNVTNEFSYGDKDSYYHITDMIEFNGNIYLSAYAVPNSDDERQAQFSRYELSDIFDYIHKNYNSNLFGISSKELTPMVREKYTALLLVCTPDGGEPKEFFSVKESLGAKLAISADGHLIWNVESIADIHFSPMTSSFSFIGSCNVFRYAFDNTGRLLSQVKTDEIAEYRR